MYYICIIYFILEYESFCEATGCLRKTCLYNTSKDQAALQELYLLTFLKNLHAIKFTFLGHMTIICLTFKLFSKVSVAFVFFQKINVRDFQLSVIHIALSVFFL